MPASNIEAPLFMYSTVFNTKKVDLLSLQPIFISKDVFPSSHCIRNCVILAKAYFCQRRLFTKKCVMLRSNPVVFWYGLRDFPLFPLHEKYSAV